MKSDEITMFFLTKCTQTEDVEKKVEHCVCNIVNYNCTCVRRDLYVRMSPIVDNWCIILCTIALVRGVMLVINTLLLVISSEVKFLLGVPTKIV